MTIAFSVRKWSARQRRSLPRDAIGYRVGCAEPRHGDGCGEGAVAYGIAWFLLLSGIRVVLLHGRHAHDAAILRQLTRLPRGVWAGLWLAGSAAALIFGGSLLV